MAEDSETETGTELASDPMPDAADQEKTNDVKDAAQMVIDYLEEVRQEEKQEEEEKAKAEEAAEQARQAEIESERIKAEQEAAEAQAEAEAQAQITAEEQEQLRAIQVEQENLNATYTSNTNVILGYAQKYKYYYAYDVPYSDGYYTRYNRYIYCWDGWPAFKVIGNTLQFSGDSLFVTALYNGDTSIDTVSEQIYLTGGRTNAYSNIEQLAYPSLYQIDDGSYKSTDEIIQVIVLISALLVGCFITKRFIIDG